MEISLHPGCVIVNYYVQCGGVGVKLLGSWGARGLQMISKPYTEIAKFLQ